MDFTFVCLLVALLIAIYLVISSQLHINRLTKELSQLLEHQAGLETKIVKVLKTQAYEGGAGATAAGICGEAGAV